MKKHLKSVISFVIALALSLSSVAAMAAPAYDDVPADASYAEAVANLTAIGVVEGYGDGKFNPDGNITRAEVATMIVRALAQDEAAKSSMGVTDFTDLPGDHWAAGYVNVASRGATAFINGMGDGTFAPDANVTYEQVIKMLVAAIGYGDWGIAKGGYPTGYINTAKEIGITKGVATVNGGDAATRAVVAQLINNAIDTPLLALSVYSPTNPEYVIMDGTKGNDYETILTYYHDIYKVSGRVVATSRSDASRIDSDKVEYQIEITDNYDDSSIVLSKGDRPETEIMLIGDTDVADYLNVYSKLLVRVTDDEDPIVLSCVASGKNVQVTLDADAWDDEKEGDDSLDKVFQGSNKGQIWYYANSDKTGKSTRYYLDDNFTLYVNGVNVIADAEDAGDDEYTAFQEYVLNNTVGTVTLVDTPTADTNSTDGKYDAIFVSYYATGIVDSVSGDKIYLSDNVGKNSKSSIEVDFDDEDMSYSFEMDGKEIEYTDLKEGDIVSIAYNPELGFSDTNFFNVIVSRNVVEGKVTETSKDDNEITVNGETYKMVDDQLASASNFDLGTSYTLYLDAFGHVADYEKLASSVKYGIISRAYYSNDADEARVVLYDTTATKKTFTVTDSFKVTDDDGTDSVGDGDDFKTWAGSYDSSADDSTAPSRVVEYTTNSAGELREVKFIGGTSASAGYSKKNNKIGSVKLDDATVVISVDGTDFALVNISSLVDDTTYEAYGYDKDNGTYSFVVITDGIGSYTSDTRFAVIEKVTQGVNEDGDECDKLLVYSAESKELLTVYTDGTDVAYGKGYSKGDVVVYKVNAAGVIEDEDDIEVIFENGNHYENYAFTQQDKADNWYADLITLPQDKNGNPIWDLDNDTEVEVRFGPVIDRSSKDLTLGEVVKNDKTYYTTDGEELEPEYVIYTDDTDGHKVEAIDFADDVAVYVYDDNNSKDNKLSVGTVGSIAKTSVSKTLRLSTSKDKNDDRTVISLDEDYYEDMDEDVPEFTYALVKIVDDEITDVFVIIPKD